jgi:hypothetical protein
MTEEVVEVFVCGPCAAADAVALGLLSAGAIVDSPDASDKLENPRGSLRGVRAVVRMASQAKIRPPIDPGPSAINMARAAKVCTGAVLMLALFGAEVKLHFGPRLDTVVTLAGIWAFWRLCLRPSAATA